MDSCTNTYRLASIEVEAGTHGDLDGCFPPSSKPLDFIDLLRCWSPGHTLSEIGPRMRRTDLQPDGVLHVHILNGMCVCTMLQSVWHHMP